MERLDNPIRHYAWGSRETIAALTGRPVPSERPEAELWMGGHPDSPSTVRRGNRAVPVGEVVAADPAGVLGEAGLRRFGPRLPFMLKLLAAGSSLSLQAHPDATAAVEGRYVDPYAKPELLVAVDDFHALCGFRDPARSAALLASLRVPALDGVVDRLGHGSASDALRGAVESLLRWPVGSRATLVASVRHAVEDLVAPKTLGYRDLAYVMPLADRFPGDMGVVVTLLLNRVTLSPDEAIWMPAGNLHAHLRGTGIEVLGASDNVLRGGLTAKPVDVEELLRIVRFEVLAEPVRKPVTVRPGVLTWPVPATEFALFKAAVTGGEPIELTVSGPRIVFCAAGRVRVDDSTPGGEGSAVAMTSGEAALGPAGRRLTIAGDGVVFVATTG
jgi:mannose-6-phosphate isomerase